MASKSIVPLAGGVYMNDTFFSTRDFVEAWSRSFGHQYRPLAIPVPGSGPARTMYAIQTPARYASRHALLAPHGLYASPGWDGRLDRSTLERILHRLMGFRTRGFVWNVRFDHESLAAGLVSLGLKFERTSTQVLYLGHGYEHVIARYNATIRNHVRKARRRGILVRDADTLEDVRAYYQLHMRLVQQKEQREGWGFVYPIELFRELMNIGRSVRLILAECEGKVVAGGLFFRDGCSVMYWHGASDRDYSRFFPSCAVFDEAIRWACTSNSVFFNFGNSAGITTLEQFKSFWGARPQLNWTFTWVSPFWARLSRLKEAAREVNLTTNELETSSPSH